MLAPQLFGIPQLTIGQCNNVFSLLLMYVVIVFKKQNFFGSNMLFFVQPLKLYLVQ